MTVTSISRAERGEGRAGLAPAQRTSRRVWRVDVLLVEDDRADTSLILDILRRNPHVANARASDAPEMVLRELASGERRPNLILLDLHMPKVGGFTFLEQLRAIPAMADTPVVILTSSCLSWDVKEARNSSASLYVVKADNYDDMNTRLSNVIYRAVVGAWSK